MLLNEPRKQELTSCHPLTDRWAYPVSTCVQTCLFRDSKQSVNKTCDRVVVFFLQINGIALWGRADQTMGSDSTWWCLFRLCEWAELCLLAKRELNGQNSWRWGEACRVICCCCCCLQRAVDSSTFSAQGAKEEPSFLRPLKVLLAVKKKRKKYQSNGDQVPVLCFYREYSAV